MRFVLFLFIFSFLLFTACKKSSQPGGALKPASLVSIQGKWELRKINGDFVAEYPAGNGNTLEFTNNNYESHSTMTGTDIEKKGTFALQSDVIPSEAQCAPPRTGTFTRLVFDNVTDGSFQIPEIDNKGLKISTNNCPALDNYSEATYVKISD